MTVSGLLVEPAWFTCPDYVKTFGDEVGELAALAGFAPDPEQQLGLDVMFGVDRFGRSAAFEVAVICSRQNLKTGLCKQAALGKVFLLERNLFVWSAHEFSTTQEAFRDLMILIEGCPTLDRQVKHIHQASGAEAIELLGGQRIKFRARTKSAGRGLTGDDVCLDEALYLTATHMGALMPTLSARPDPQIIYGSSAGLAQSAVLRDIRDRGRAGDRRLAYLEWCAPDPDVACDAGAECEHGKDAVGCGCDKPDMIQRANPAVGRRITAEYIVAERQALPPGEFMRERMGWWDEPLLAVEPPAIDLDVWLAQSDPASATVRVACFAVATSLDREWSSISVAGPRAGPRRFVASDDDGSQDILQKLSSVTVPGGVHVETVEHGRGTGWLAARCIELVAGNGWVPVVVDEAGPAATEIPALEDAGVLVIKAGTRDVAQSYALVLDGLAEHELWHGPQPELEDAVKAAKPRPCGDGGSAFGRRRSGGDISPLESVGLAYWGFQTLVREAPSLW